VRVNVRPFPRFHPSVRAEGQWPSSRDGTQKECSVFNDVLVCEVSIPMTARCSPSAPSFKGKGPVRE